MDSAIVEANPTGREEAAAVGGGLDSSALLEAVATEPLPNLSAPSSGRGYLLPLVVLLSAAVVAVGFVSPPGQAVADWVGERLGFGEPGGAPALRQLNESWAAGTSAKTASQRVLVVGPVILREQSRYEFITFEMKHRSGSPLSRLDGRPCFKLDLTQVRSMFGLGCGTLPKGREFAYTGPGGGFGHLYRGEDGGLHAVDELFHVSGRVGPNVVGIEATIDGRRVPIQLRPIPNDLRKRFDLGRPFSLFIGFFEGAVRGGTVEVTARDADGKILGHGTSVLPNQIVGRKFACRDMLKHLDQIPRKGLAECNLILGHMGTGR